MLIKYVKKKIYGLFFWRLPVGELLSSQYDISKHLKYSFNHKNLNDKERLIHYITKQYHIIEKGLALPKPRLGFGQEKIELLIKLSKSYISLYGNSPLIYSVSSCLKDYLQFNENNSAELPVTFKRKIDDFVQEIESKHLGGARSVSKDDLILCSNIDFESFVRSRYSIRDFSKENVEISTISDAVEIAKYAPSACNRQGWLAHVYSDSRLMSELLKIQGGNAGFTDSINKLIIVTGNIKAFTKFECNQIFIDGGLFSMNLMFSLHNKGVGTCPLSTGFSYVIENKVKRIANIPDSERLIMMIAVGNLKDQFRVAISERKSVNDILVLH